MKHSIFTPISQESYQNRQSDRILNDSIKQDELYLFMARLEGSRLIAAGEFSLLTTRLAPEMGRLSLIGSLYDDVKQEPFLTLEGSVEQGILTPYRSGGVHVTHPETGSLGLLREGYLIAHPQAQARLGQSALTSLYESVALDEPREYTDLSTAAFELQGIYRGYN
ncbi:hypothetical protein KI440_02970 [Candidatus Saccharibacteria bacterium TM7i]|nr:hypothetical protein KI440_02970 [Candidatus Saccharibacteria bacterium TM7i]